MQLRVLVDLHRIDMSLTDTAERGRVLCLHEIDETSGPEVEMGGAKLCLGH